MQEGETAGRWRIRCCWTTGSSVSQHNQKSLRPFWQKRYGNTLRLFTFFPTFSCHHSTRLMHPRPDRPVDLWERKFLYPRTDNNIADSLESRRKLRPQSSLETRLFGCITCWFIEAAVRGEVFGPGLFCDGFLPLWWVNFGAKIVRMRTEAISLTIGNRSHIHVSDSWGLLCYFTPLWLMETWRRLVDGTTGPMSGVKQK